MTDIFAHRGSAGTRPENTMISFLEAERLGADGIELDVQMTKDNHLVVIHDELVNRTTNGKGRVEDFTLKDLQKLDAGSWFSRKYRNERIPTLKEVMDWIKSTDLSLNIELKNGLVQYDRLEERVIEMVKQYRLLERVIVSSFNHYSIEKIHELNPWIEGAVLFMEGLYKPWEYARKVGARGIHPRWRVVLPDMIIGAKKANIAIRPFTVNQEKQMRTFITAACTAIITDRPEKALNVREAVRRTKH
jgi:glycerophosphoryl diester phosphodiesterase